MIQSDFSLLERKETNEKWLAEGVIIIDPNTTYISPESIIETDVIIWPNSYIVGTSKVGKKSVIGPNSYIQDSYVGQECVIRFSVVEQAKIDDYVEIGPFCHLRKGTHLAEHVHIGNFGEVKNSYLGSYSKMGHFSYIGDAQIGSHVNIGAGTITCNYDGANKHKTVVGNNSFIGSDTMLVAPLTIGQNVRTGAGSVVTQDIPDDTLAYGVPARHKVSH